MGGVAAMGHLFERGKVLFAAAARIVQLDAAIVADIGEIVGVEEGSVICELGELVAVPKAAALMADIAGEDECFAGRQWLIKRVDGIQVARCGTDQMEGAVEMDVR